MKNLSIILNVILASAMVGACFMPTRHVADSPGTDDRTAGVDVGNKAPASQRSENIGTQIIEPQQQGGINFSLVVAAASGGAGVFLINKIGDTITDGKREQTMRMLIFVIREFARARAPP